MMLPEIAKQNQLARIEEKKTIMLDPHVVAALTKTEYLAAKSSIGTLISHYSELEFSVKASALAINICKELGIRIEQEDLKFYAKRFVETLRDYYSNFTLEQIEESFKLLLRGELDEYLPRDKYGNPDRSHYQTFSLEFISKVLRAFESYNNKLWFKATKAIPEPEKVWSKQEIDEAYEGVWQDILEKFQLFKNDGILSDFTAPSISARVLHQKGKIVEICPVSDSDIRKSFALLMNNDEINVYDKSEMRKTFDSGKIHQRHFVEAERLRDLRIIREVFENEKEL